MNLDDIVPVADGARQGMSAVHLGMAGLGTAPYGHPSTWNWAITRWMVAVALKGHVFKRRSGWGGIVMPSDVEPEQLSGATLERHAGVLQADVGGEQP